MTDHHFSDAALAEWYDVLHPWEDRDDLAFYLPLVMSAESVLDIGCGTGSLLRRARDEGHTGRLCGLDPAPGMLGVARTRLDIEWIPGTMESAAWAGEFDLVVMSGHAFQVFLTDAELRTSLAAIRSALTASGRFAFETRNPPVRTWERWVPANAVEAAMSSGVVVRMAHQVETPVAGDLVSFTTTYTSADWDEPEFSHSTLRFIGAADLGGFLADAGLAIAEQYGDWDRTPLTDTSPEIITIARPA